MRIRVCGKKDWGALRSVFPELPAKPSLKSVAVWCEEAGSAWALAWAEPSREKPREWDLRVIAVAAGKKGLGLESQLLITLEIEIEKRGGASLSAWTDADLDAETPQAERDLFKVRGYRLREYRADYFGASAPGDRWTRALNPEGFPETGESEKRDKPEGPRYRFPIVGLN